MDPPKTNTDLTSALSDYVTNTDLTLALNNYATTTALSNYVTNTDLAGYVTNTDLAGYASLSANNTFNGTQTLNSGITVNKTTSNGTACQFIVDDQGWTVEGPFRVKLGAQNLLTLIPSAPQQPTSSAQIGTNLDVTGNLSTTGTLSTPGSVTGDQILATGAFSATPRAGLGGTGATHSYPNGVEPVLHVLHDSVNNIGRWTARSTDGYYGFLSAHNTIYASYPSDDRLKYDEIPVTGAITYLKALQPRHYTKKKSLIDADEGGIEEYGFIAQDVESIEGLECLVSEDMDCRDPSLRVKHLNYHGLTTISVQALKELITTVEDLETRLAALEAP